MSNGRSKLAIKNEYVQSGRSAIVALNDIGCLFFYREGRGERLF